MNKHYVISSLLGLDSPTDNTKENATPKKKTE